MYLIYSKYNCGYCTKTKNLIDEYHIKDYRIIMIDSNYDDTIEGFKQKYNHKTFPFIFEKTQNSEKFIGGFTEFKQLIQDTFF